MFMFVTVIVFELWCTVPCILTSNQQLCSFLHVQGNRKIERKVAVFHCRHAFLPLVNSLVSLVRIRSKKSLICRQSPQGFIGEDIQLLYCFPLDLTLPFIYFYCSPRLICALFCILRLSLWYIWTFFSSLLLEVLYTNLEILDCQFEHKFTFQHLIFLLVLYQV